jgi:hypothetical protein
MPLIEKASVPTTIVLGLLVTLETPCSLPFMLVQQRFLHNLVWQFHSLLDTFSITIFLFVLPLIVVLVIVWRAKK